MLKSAAVAALAAASGALVPAADAAIVKIPLQKTAFQETVHLPLRDSEISGSYNVVLVAENGHDAESATTNICQGMATNFNVASGSYSERCPRRMAALIREARGLDFQHDAPYVSEVEALHERLSQDGYMVREFEASNVWFKPFRAQALKKLIGGLEATTGGLKTVCEVGVGAGHSALLFLTAAPKARVVGFDLGVSRYTLPAHDYLDDRYPERLAVYIGESSLTVPRYPDFYPEPPGCQLIYLDGGSSYQEVMTDLSNFKKIVDVEKEMVAVTNADGSTSTVAASTGGHVIVLANAGEGTDAARAWQDLVTNGTIAWEMTVYESPTVALSDRLLIGRYKGEGVGDAIRRP